MNHKPLTLLLALALCACSSETGKTGTDSTTGQSGTTAPPAPQRDSVLIDVASSSVKWERAKTVKNVKQKVKLGNATIEMNLDEASFTASGDIPVKNGAWYSLGKQPDGGTIRLDMTKLQAVQVGNDQRLEMTSPDYLDVEHFPTAQLRFNKLDSDGKGGYTAAMSLTVRDTTGAVSFPVTVQNGADGLPSKLSGTFTIDGMKWGLNRRNAKVTKDAMTFEVLFVTKR